MSKVSRSTYQKCAEENKRLKKDIEALVMIDSKEETKKVFVRWREHFKSQRQFNALMRTVAKEYIREHKDELPDFLTRAVEDPSNKDAVLPLCGVSNSVQNKPDWCTKDGDCTANFKCKDPKMIIVILHDC